MMRRHVYPDIVSAQDLATLPPNATACAAAQLMTHREIGSVLVGDNGRMYGIVTEGDIAERVVAKGLDPNVTALSAIMTPNPVCAQADETPMEALERMNDGHFCHLPIQQNGAIIGMLVRRDFSPDETECAEFERSLWEHMR